MFSWHKCKDEKSVHKNWHTLATPDFDGEWHPEHIERTLCRFIWSPIKWRDGIRKESHFLGSLVCALDFDSPNTSLEWARETFKEYDVIIGTTKSHQKEKKGIVCERFRVVLWFTEPITDLALYKHNMVLLIQKYGADKACNDGARFFFPCTEIVESHGGKCVEIEPLPVVSKENTSLYGVKRRRGMNYIIDAYPAVDHRNSTVFSVGCRLFRTKLDYDLIIDKLRVISNGLPEDEFERTVKRCQEYAKK